MCLSATFEKEIYSIHRRTNGVQATEAIEKTSTPSALQESHLLKIIRFRRLVKILSGQDDNKFSSILGSVKSLPYRHLSGNKTFSSITAANAVLVCLFPCVQRIDITRIVRGVYEFVYRLFIVYLSYPPCQLATVSSCFPFLSRGNGDVSFSRILILFR